MNKIKYLTLALLLMNFYSCKSGKATAKPGSDNSIQTTSVSSIKIVDGDVGTIDTSAYASWSPIQNASYYEISIGTSPDKSDVKDWLNIGNTLNTSLSINENINLNQTYYTNIRAKDVDGKIIASGNGDGWKAIGDLANNTNASNLSFNGFVKSMAIDKNGNKYFSGSFNAINPTANYGLVALDTNGHLVSSFNPGYAYNSYGANLLTLRTGKILSLNTNQIYNNVNIGKTIIRLNSTGTYDSSFILDSSFPAYPSNLTMKEDSSGNIFILYYSSGIKFSKLSSSGTIDSSFATNISSHSLTSYNFTLTSDNKILITTSSGIIKLNNDGTQDNSFTPISTTYEYKSIETNNSKILIYSNGNIYQFLANGSLEKTLVASTSLKISNIVKIITTSDSNFYIFGLNSKNEYLLQKINSTGVIDTAFDSNIGSGFGRTNTITDAIIDSNNKIYLYGSFHLFNGIETPQNIVRLNTNGSIDTSFINNKAGFNTTVSSVIVNGSNVIVSGDFTLFGGTYTGSFVKMDRQNNIQEFDNSIRVNGEINKIKILDDKILIAGDFTKINNTTRNKIAQINLDGTLTKNFSGSGFNKNGRIYDFDIFKNKSLILSGDFYSYNGANSNKVIKIFSDGTRDSSFSIGSGFNAEGESIYVVRAQRDNKILINGDYTTYRGESVNKLIRLNENGTIDSSFNIGTGFNSTLRDVIVLDDNTSIYCGIFSTFNGKSVSSIAKLDSNGSLNNNFVLDSSYALSSCSTISLLENNQILLSGIAFSSDHDNLSYFLKFDQLGNIDHAATYDLPFGTYNGTAFSVVEDYDGNIFVGGYLYENDLLKSIMLFSPN